MPNQNTQTLRDRMLAVMADVNAQVAEREEPLEENGLKFQYFTYRRK